MKDLKSGLKVIILVLVLAALDASFEAQTKEAPNSAPEASSFDISIFFKIGYSPIRVGNLMTSTYSLVTFLACPKKGDPKKGTQRKSFTAGSVVLSTFRKLALRAQTVRNV